MRNVDVSSLSSRPRPLQARPRRRHRPPAERLAALLVGWAYLPPHRISERVHEIQRLAADPAAPLHLNARAWACVDRMRQTLADSQHPQSLDRE
jgi:hypothetical protein